MQVYEIGNPSDAYTMKSDNVVAASLACMYLGEGAYNLTDRDGKVVCPFFILGGDPEKWLRDTHGIGFTEALEQLHAEIADALASVMIGGFSDRDDAESAIARMRPADAEAWLEERHDRQRSSMNNIGRRAKSLAAAFRKPRKAASTPAKA